MFWNLILRRTSRPEGSAPRERHPQGVEHTEVGCGGRGFLLSLLFSDIDILFRCWGWWERTSTNWTHPSEETGLTETLGGFLHRRLDLQLACFQGGRSVVPVLSGGVSALRLFWKTGIDTVTASFTPFVFPQTPRLPSQIPSELLLFCEESQIKRTRPAFPLVLKQTWLTAQQKHIPLRHSKTRLNGDSLEGTGSLFSFFLRCFFKC